MKKNKEFVVLEKEKDLYRTISSNLWGEMFGLQCLLINELRTPSCCDKWLGCISDPSFEFLCGNLMCIARDGNEFRTLDEIERKPSKYDFVTTLENMQKILNDWKAAISNPDYNVITMTRDGDKIIFEGRWEDDPSKILSGDVTLTKP